MKSLSFLILVLMLQYLASTGYCQEQPPSSSVTVSSGFHATQNGESFTPGDEEANVGDQLELTGTVTVVDQNTGEILCEEEMTDTSSIFSDPSMVYGSAEYTLTAGVYVSTVATTANPIVFRVQSAGVSTVSMTGSACLEYTGGPTTASAAIDVVGSTVSITQATCPSQPTLDTSAPATLVWLDKNNNPCKFVFQVTNNMDVSASYGVMNILLSVQNYLILSTGAQINFVQADNVLDPRPNDGGGLDFVYPTEDGIAPGTSTPLTFLDNPSTTLSTCYIPTGGSSQAVTSVGFVLKFNTFILQNWDSATGNAIPVDAQASSWKLVGQADQVSGKWAVNSQVSQLTGPSTIGLSRAQEQYSSYVGAPGSTTAKYDDATGCYIQTS